MEREGTIELLCKQRHTDLERRLGTMESAINDNESTFAQSLTRIHDRIDEDLKKLAARPTWAVATIITLLSSGFFVLLAIVLKG